jgi:uncharacterized protein YqgC (DUF456 family)
MDLILVILAGLAIAAGIFGSFLPFLPGPPLAWAGLLMLHFSSYASFSTTFLVITAIVTLILAVLDYLLPIWAAKRSGGTKWGQRGAIAGMLIGLLAGPLGLILGPLIGAFAGELLHDSSDMTKARRAAWNSFTGFLLSTGLQMGWCLVILFWYIRALV